ncbi:MAG: GntR family transcriptional regulator [Bacillota bacterium]
MSEDAKQCLNRVIIPTRADAVYRALKEAILLGTFAPGTEVTQEEIAKQMGVSRMPIRDAIRRLERDGLVRLSAYRSAVVVGVSLDDFKEVYFMRALLEGAATELACPRLQEKDHEELRRAIEQMDQVVGTGDEDAIVEANSRFHYIVYDAAGSPRLKKAITELWDLFPQTIVSTVSGRAVESVTEHTELLAALKSRDSELAGRLMRQHIERSRDVLMAVWQERFPNQAL